MRWFKRFWISFFIFLYAACHPTPPNHLTPKKFSPAEKAIWREDLLRWQRERLRLVQQMPYATKKTLRFFSIHARYCLEGPLQLIQPPEKVIFQTSDGRKREGWKWAKVKLWFNRKSYTLTLYKLADLLESHPNHLFLPFVDAQAGKETYGGGRYLDLEVQGKEVEIDFNKAYNPDCAYGIPASCPLAPPENHLPIPIPAGEKVPLSKDG